MIKNEYKIANITIRNDKAKCYCPLGKDWYTNQFEIYIEPAEYIPDYCDVDKYIEENINGKELIIEAAVALLYDYIMETYRPRTLAVTSSVEDAAHSEVTVERASYEMG